MTLTLYYSPGAGSMSSHIALEEAGATYEARLVKLAENAQRSPEYLALNPHGRVPALQLEDGTVIAESAAVLTYVAQSFPKAKLFPKEPLAQARCIEWLAWLASSVHVAFAQTRRPMRYAGQNEAAFPAVRAAGEAYLRTAYAEIERRIAQSEYAVGDAYSIADMHLFLFYIWGRGAQLAGTQATPAFVKWGQKVAARAAVQRVAEVENIRVQTLI